MKILLDTNVLLWVLARKTRIGPETARLLEDAANEVRFSAVSIWEIAIKFSLGRADFRDHPAKVLDMAVAAGLAEMPVTAAVAATVAELPRLHGDPFDHLLIAQAKAAPARFFTADRALAEYSELVTVIR